MKKNIYLILLVFIMTSLGVSTQAKENTGIKVQAKAKRKSTREGSCQPASAAVDLDINNIRTRILNGGDMWWDLTSSPRYEVPKVTQVGEVRRHAMFAGALWIGGLENNNLKLAAMTYRQSGSDFFPGPLDTSNATISPEECLKYDKIWKVELADIEAFKSNRALITDDMLSWPAHGNTNIGQAKFLAPFVNVGGDPYLYEPEEGDYPEILGDQSLFFIYNDKGDIHTETRADPIGLEIMTNAFAIQTNDEVNNMTFYRSTITNRAATTLDSCYFGQWVDPDLGYAFDDYVGCDVNRSLGICYNGRDFDPGATGYGDNPPSVGVDFFEGPLDENGNEIGLSKFVYYENNFTLQGNPSEAIHFYYYLTGRWKNGDCVRLEPGGDGFNCPSCPCTDYMYPDDPERPLPSWSERTSNNPPGDRRFLQSAGPFSLQPGATNNVTVGVVWARTTTGGAVGSLNLLRLASDKAQRLYNNSFELVDGPREPQASVRELDRKIVIAITNGKDVESYYDSAFDENGDVTYYEFEGYQIFQLKDATVSASELDNPDRARLVTVVDVNNGINQLVNTIFIPGLGNQLVEKVSSPDEGIKRTFVIEEDAFASGENQLRNYTTYYYRIVAYARALSATEPEQYIPNRISRQVVVAMPARPDSKFGGTLLQSDYGDGPEVSRLEGAGNPGVNLRITKATEDSILSTGRAREVTYQGGASPISVKVFDPFLIEPATYELSLVDTNDQSTSITENQRISDNTRWTLTNLNSGEVILSDTSIGVITEQVALGFNNRNLGFSVTLRNDTSLNAADNEPSNGFVGASIRYADSTLAWFGGITDLDQEIIGTSDPNFPFPQNWIRSGRNGSLANHDLTIADAADTRSGRFYWTDPETRFENMINSSLAPAALAARTRSTTNGNRTLGPIPEDVSYGFTRLENTPNIDLVFTSDRSKWTKCIVLEMGEEASTNEGGSAKFAKRNHPSLLLEPGPNGEPVYSTDPNDIGFSWFPGYAVNVETGERLNIIFGENSNDYKNNGADLIWNPTSNNFDFSGGVFDQAAYPWGGRHWVYVMNSQMYNTTTLSGLTVPVAYDEGVTYDNILKGASARLRRELFGSIGYVLGPTVLENRGLLSWEEGLIPTETRISARVARPFVSQSAIATAETNNNKGYPRYRFSMDALSKLTDAESGKKGVSNITITPNPYYAFNRYETSQLDNRVRFTNLPQKCEIYIYTQNGNLVRKFTKNEPSNVSTPSLDWDLKNQNGIPISSGIYIVHINAFDLGTTVLKWFGIMRPIDLDTF